MDKTDLTLILAVLGILLALHITATTAISFLLGALLAYHLTRPDP